MPVAQLAPEIHLLLRMLDHSYDKKAWHGPNLRGSIRGLTAAQVSWRPGPNRRSIADNVVHCAYWKYAVRRRLRGDQRGSFPIKGSNWFHLPEPLSEPTWREHLALLEEQHRALRAAVAEYPVEGLHKASPGSRSTALTLIHGIASHDVYHAGQIQLLKRLQAQSQEGSRPRRAGAVKSVFGSRP
jgi:uncharacterized damage-inducible protein DinB